jgi:predicted metal-dependent HD superfamily phosphohydrolase
MSEGSNPRASGALLLELTRLYCEPHRRYHGLVHIAEMLETGRALDLDDDQVWAVWFHDAIYDPRRPDNEARSAELAAERLRAIGWPADGIERVRRIVLDTCGHQASSEHSWKVLDLDLSPLAAPRARFEKNSRDLAEEYAHLDAQALREGRAKFAEGFLARERLFYTPWGERLEAQARENLVLLRDGLV